MVERHTSTTKGPVHFSVSAEIVGEGSIFRPAVMITTTTEQNSTRVGEIASIERQLQIETALRFGKEVLTGGLHSAALIYSARDIASGIVHRDLPKVRRGAIVLGALALLSDAATRPTRYELAKNELAAIVYARRSKNRKDKVQNLV